MMKSFYCFFKSAVLLIIFLSLPLNGYSQTLDKAIEDPLSSSILSLSDIERKWLKANPEIHVSGPKDFPPFYFRDKSGAATGISADYLALIQKKLAVKLKFNQDLSWEKCHELAESRQINMIICAAQTEERDVYLDFSEPYISFPYVIVSRKDTEFISGIDKLNYKTIAVMKKSFQEERLKQDGITFQPYYVESPLKGLEAVVFGYADAQIENLAAASYLIQHNGLSNLKIAAPTPYDKYDIRIAVPKGNEIFLSIINKALASIKVEEHNRIYNKWLPVRYEYGITKKDILKWMVLVASFSLIIIAIILFWNRKLKKESQIRKKAQEELAESEKRYRLLYKNAPAGMYEIDFVANKFIKVNEIMCSYTGYTEKEFLEIDPIKLLTPKSQAKYINRLRVFLEKGEMPSEIVEYEVVKKDGGIIGAVLHTENTVKDGNLVSAQVVVHDITQLKKAEDEKIRAQKIAGEHEKMALVGQIAGKMAHDFNNILGIIMGNAELSMLDAKDPEAKASFELIFEQTLRGKNLTKNLVAFAKDHEPRQKYFNLNEKINLVLGLLKNDLKTIRLIKNFHLEMPDILADPGMIEHAIVNLVQNSIHAVSLKKNPLIKIRTDVDRKSVRFEIEDNGCGIPKTYIDDIYEPSFSLKGSRDTQQAYSLEIKGTGYGMSNVKKYIELHKGTINVESTQGEGTLFSITLPLFSKELTPEEKKSLKSDDIVSEKRILLVEDEKEISDIQQRVLTQNPCNHSVDVASTAALAIELFDSNTYDAVSLDYVLSGKVTGMDVYNHIRKLNRNIPVLFISGNFTFLESIKDLMIKDPYIDHLSKPCRNKDYISSINRLLKF